MFFSYFINSVSTFGAFLARYYRVIFSIRNKFFNKFFAVFEVIWKNTSGISSIRLNNLFAGVFAKKRWKKDRQRKFFQKIKNFYTGPYFDKNTGKMYVSKLAKNGNFFVEGNWVMETGSNFTNRRSWLGEQSGKVWADLSKFPVLAGEFVCQKGYLFF